MLTKFKLANFKSYKESTLELGPLTLLIGANASGKSNVLEGFQMLSWLARGRRLDDVFRAVQESELTIRGTVADLTYNQADAFTLGCSLRHDSIWTGLEAEIAVGNNGMRIQQERILSPNEQLPLYWVAQDSHGVSNNLLVTYNNFSPGPNKPQVTCTDQLAVFTQLQTPARFAERHKRSQKDIPAVTKAFMDALSSVLFLDPSPRRMRGYSFIVDKVLKGDGANISSTLFDLCDTQQAKDKVLAFVRDLPEQDIADIKFLSGPRREVMVQFAESFGGRRELRDATVLSDGSLRVVAVAAALLSAAEGSTVVVEEIDNGVHPSRAKTLLANIERVAKERKLVVVLTSHNPALLDALPVTSLPNVVFCYRDPECGDSRLVRLSDLPAYPELVAQGPLGRLLTQGIVDRFVKTATTPEQQVQQKLHWIEELEKTSAAS